MGLTREEVAAALEQIAVLLELKGENPFKIRAYRNGARAVEMLEEDLGTLVREDRLAGVEGIGDALREKITTLVTEGHLPFLDQLRAGFPEGLFELFDVPGLGPKKIKALHEQLGVASRADLVAACRDGRVAGLPGFGAKTQANLLTSLESIDRSSGRFLLGEAAPAARQILDLLRQHPQTLRVSVAGSLRRRNETVHDLDFIASTSDPASVSRAFREMPGVAAVLAAGDTKSSIRLANGLQCDLRVVTDAEFPFALSYFTGSKQHNIVLRGLALEKGWTLNEYRLGVAREGAAAPPPVREERDLYAAFGLAYIEPELREDRGEFAAAREDRLPVLVELANLRGTFHCHTRESDGRNTLEEMAAAAVDLGLEYLGIADHSKASFQARGLDAPRLAAQVQAIRELNGRVPDLRVFAGTECDILKDGSLDFPDEILARLDYVVASVHSSLGLDEAAMTARLIRAMENPHVTMLGHPTGRLLLKREASAVDLPAVLDAAAATGTWIELNADPHRLDLDWRWWRMAVEKGVRCVINPDAHSCAGLQNLYFGLGIARKGGLRREDVVNCLPLAEMDHALQAKRRAAGLVPP